MGSTVQAAQTAQTAGTILLVDDEPMVLRTLADQLHELGFCVSTATSGDEAYTLILQGAAFDLLLTDIRMPGRLDGFDLIRMVRDARPTAKTIAMSGWVGMDNLNVHTADAFLEKPFTHARLERELGSLLGAAN